MADELNFQVAAEGFGSYLDGILPAEIATSAGAFSATMQQIRNILSVDFEKFAQVAYSTEVVNAGLNLVNGSDIPTNLNEAQQGYNITSIGSGPYGTYTMSDFFGCMSGLPYMWNDILSGISGLQTTKLRNIYQELFLAVTWDKAYCTISTNAYYVNITQYTLNASNPDYPAIDPVNPYIQCGTGVPTTDYLCTPREDDLYYTVTITAGPIGGGYGRGTAPAPTVTLSPNNCNASVITTVGTNNSDAQSLGGGTFGRISFTINNGSPFKYKTVINSSNNNPPSLTGSNAPPVESIRVDAPPTATLAVTPSGAVATGGSNVTGDTYYSVGSPSAGTIGWPAMNSSAVQPYINQANAEIANIRTTQPYKSYLLNTVYNAAGTQLKIEQRARFTGIPPVPTKGFGDAAGRDDFLNIYPTSLSVFVDSVPFLAQNTRPHMYAQTLEAISNVNTVGGQSIIAMMRQERNAARLQEIGIDLDNNIPGDYDPEVAKMLISNGTVPNTPEGISVTGINGNPKNPITNYTIPSSLFVPKTGGIGSSGFSGFSGFSGVNPTNVISPKPLGFYDPNTTQFKVTPATSAIGQFSPLQQLVNLQNNNVNSRNLLGPANNGTGPAAPKIIPSNASKLNGTALSPNSINPNPNQVPLNFQTGTNNLGPGVGPGTGSTPASAGGSSISLTGSGGALTPVSNPTTGLTPVNNPSGSASPATLLQRILLGGNNSTNLVNPVSPILNNLLNPAEITFGVVPTALDNLLNPNEINSGIGSTGLDDLLGPAGINLGIGPGLITAPLSETEPIVVVNTGPQLPIGVGTPIDIGKAIIPGSLAGSKATNLLPSNLNAAYIASTLIPSTLSVQEAIEDVIRCNCDCWVD